MEPENLYVRILRNETDRAKSLLRAPWPVGSISSCAKPTTRPTDDPQTTARYVTPPHENK